LIILIGAATPSSTVNLSMSPTLRWVLRLGHTAPRARVKSMN
jgi:hypothetical protein